MSQHKKNYYYYGLRVCSMTVKEYEQLKGLKQKSFALGCVIDGEIEPVYINIKKLDAVLETYRMFPTR